MTNSFRRCDRLATIAECDTHGWGVKQWQGVGSTQQHLSENGHCDCHQCDSQRVNDYNFGDIICQMSHGKSGSSQQTIQRSCLPTQWCTTSKKQSFWGRVAIKIFEDFEGTLCKEFITGREPVWIIHYTRQGTCINRPLHLALIQYQVAHPKLISYTTACKLACRLPQK